jgi:hypothetical protein
MQSGRLYHTGVGHAQGREGEMERGKVERQTWGMSVVASLLLLTAVAVALAVEGAIGQIKTLTGEVSIIRQNEPRPARVGDLLEQADTVITGAESSVGITFIDNSRFSAGPNSHIALEQFRFDPTTHEGVFRTRMQRGTLTIISGQIAKRTPEAMQVQTPTSILGVRGTKFLVRVKE